jgi:steroid delta-isomerase-like uncharacterized protein
MSEQNKAVVRRLVEEHWNNRNTGIVDELFAPDATMDTPDGPFTGRDGASALLQAYATAFPDFRNTIDDLFAEGNEVVFRWTFNGTNTGAFGETPATGKHVNLPGCIGIFQLDEGKVSRGHLCWDRYGLYQQIGLI